VPHEIESPKPEEEVPYSVRVVFQVYDPDKQNYKYRPGFSTSAKLATLKDLDKAQAEVRRVVRGIEAAGVVDRARRRAAGDPVDSSGDEAGE
jgi:hypothetical protein